MYKSFGGALGVQKLNSATALIQRHQRRLPHAEYVLHWAGCSQEDDQLLREGWQRPHSRGRFPAATRFDLDRWMKTLPVPWTAAMEATVFTGWIYDHLQPHATALKVAHPLMLRAIAAAKKKNDRVDASKICGCLRCDFLPECYMASTAIRERRRTLRYRNLLVRQMVQMKNNTRAPPKCVRRAFAL